MNLTNDEKVLNAINILTEKRDSISRDTEELNSLIVELEEKLIDLKNKEYLQENKVNALSRAIVIIGGNEDE